MYQDEARVVYTTFAETHARWAVSAAHIAIESGDRLTQLIQCQGNLSIA